MVATRQQCLPSSTVWSGQRRRVGVVLGLESVHGHVLYGCLIPHTSLLYPPDFLEQHFVYQMATAVRNIARPLHVPTQESNAVAPDTQLRI